jgi:hypothetical protein
LHFSAINPKWSSPGSNQGFLHLSHSTYDNTEEEEEGDEKEEAKGEEE